jgi:hypothetical protein
MENLSYFHRLQQQANAACDQCVEIARNTTDTRTQYLANKAAQLCLEICQCCNPEAPQADVKNAAYGQGNWGPQAGTGWNQGHVTGYKGVPVPTPRNFERIQQLANEACACCVEISRNNPDVRIQFLANSACQCCLDVCQCCNVESGQAAREPQWAGPVGSHHVPAYQAAAFNTPQQPYGFSPYKQ